MLVQVGFSYTCPDDYILEHEIKIPNRPKVTNMGIRYLSRWYALVPYHSGGKKSLISSLTSP